MRVCHPTTGDTKIPFDGIRVRPDFDCPYACAPNASPDGIVTALPQNEHGILYPPACPSTCSFFLQKGHKNSMSAIVCDPPLEVVPPPSVTPQISLATHCCHLFTNPDDPITANCSFFRITQIRPNRCCFRNEWECQEEEQGDQQGISKPDRTHCGLGTIGMTHFHDGRLQKGRMNGKTGAAKLNWSEQLN